MLSQKQNKPVISFRNVTFAYDKLPIIKKANFDVSQGEFIGIIGPNGGGKTTALKLILGFLKPGKGKVFLRGSVGYVPQINNYDKQFPITVREVIMTGCLSEMSFLGKYSKKAEERAKKLMETFNLQHIKDQSFGSLSGGQGQKTLIARALVSDPPILLLDEPTANIDAETEKQVFAFLKSLQRKKTILVVTHNFDAIMENVERVLCFQREVSSIAPQNVCKHFSMGMYHQAGRHSDV